MRHKKKSKILILIGITVIMLAGCTSTEEPVEITQEEIMEFIKVELVFANNEYVVEDDSLVKSSEEYKSEKRKIEIEEEDKMLHGIISGLMVKPEDRALSTSFPETVELLSVYIEGNILYIDFAEDGLSGSSSQELGTINQVLRTAENINKTGHFKEIEQVVFLVEGEIVETLMGHVLSLDPFVLGAEEK